MKLSKFLNKQLNFDVEAELNKAILKRELNKLAGKDHLYKKLQEKGKYNL